jgi:two-component system, cell cycle response regulator
MPERRGMGLRGRLTAFFVVITVLPLLLAVVALQVQIDQQLRVRSETELTSVRQAAIALVGAARARAGDYATDLAAALARDPIAADLDAEGAEDGVRAFLAAAAEPAVPLRADVALVAGPDGQLLGGVGRTPEPAGGRSGPDLAALAAAAPARDPVPGAIYEVRELQGAVGIAPLGFVVTALWTDDVLLQGVGITGNAALVLEGEVLAVTGGALGAVPDVPPGPPGSVVAVETSGGEVLATSAPLADVELGEPATTLVVWTPRGERPSSVAVALLIVVPAVLAAALIGFVLATTVISPVRRAAEVARAVAAGDLSRHLEPSGGRELADLSVALNQMSAELATRLQELADREQQLRDSLARLGQTLSSSLDLNRTLSVVVDTARETLAADRAFLALFTPERDALYTKVGRGLDGPGPRLRLGEGLVGAVAERGTPVLLPGGGDEPVPAESEPFAASQLAVPLLVRGRVLGVLSLLRDDEDHPFTRSDLDTVRSFAQQASVAIENVMLHEEAQRLSVTDPLTGLWNFRYFQIQADRELEAAARSGRPVSLIVLDIDRFKTVNDRFGHQVGDEVLIEVARRLRDSTRLPDVVARYGGEEFIVLLPDTGEEGAAATAERIRAAVAAAPVRTSLPGVTATTGGPAVEPLDITCSVGVSTLPEHGTTVAALLRAADAAMYSAKQRGRDRVVVAGATA